MIVFIGLEYDVKFLDGPEADEIMDRLTNDTKRLAAELGAVDCWVDNAVGTTDAASYT